MLLKHFFFNYRYLIDQKLLASKKTFFKGQPFFIPSTAEDNTDELASLYSSHLVWADFSLILIVKKELAGLTLTQETF